MFRSIATLCLVGCAASLAASPADEPKGDLALLQGTWSGKIGPDREISATLTIKDAKAEIRIERPGEDDVSIKGELKLDEKASPKALDWVKFTLPNGDDLPDTKALYRLEGDVWTICSGNPGGDRPAEFKEGTDGPPRIAAWNRVKPKDKDKEEAVAGDLARFQGAWTAATGPDKDRVLAMEIRGNAVTARWPTGDGDPMVLKGEVKLDDSSKPARIDFVRFKREDGEGVHDTLGIYAVEGEDIKVCIGEPEGERPGEFRSGDEPYPMLLIFKKKK